MGADDRRTQKNRAGEQRNAAGRAAGQRERRDRATHGPCCQRPRQASKLKARCALCRHAAPSCQLAQTHSWWPGCASSGVSRPAFASQAGTASSLLLLSPRWLALPVGVSGSTPTGDAGSGAACPAGQRQYGGWEKVTLPAWPGNHPQYSDRQLANKPANPTSQQSIQLQGTAASCAWPPLGSRCGGDRRGRMRGGVRLGMGRERPSCLASAAAAGPEQGQGESAGVGSARMHSGVKRVVSIVESTAGCTCHTHPGGHRWPHTHPAVD